MSSPASESEILKAIFERRSVRHFQDSPVDRETIRILLTAASWAPSGLNNEPWRFAVIRDTEIKKHIGELTRYCSTIEAAPVVIAVFLDKENSYDYVKDCQAIGACIQNMLLAAHDRGLGAVWIGEILKNRDKVAGLLGLPDRLELMAVVAVGEPTHRNQSSHRRPIEDSIVFDK